MYCDIPSVDGLSTNGVQHTPSVNMLNIMHLQGRLLHGAYKVEILIAMSLLIHVQYVHVARMCVLSCIFYRP